jgi:sulfite exporter TauE/SafE
VLSSLLAAAAVLGLLGSLHCALMCGPLLAAGCAGGAGTRARSVAAYFNGRLASHVFAGAVFGALGAHAAEWLSRSLWQRALLFTIAALALIKGARLLFIGRRVSLMTIGHGPRSPGFGGWIAAQLPRRALPLGLATGALPCGLLAGAWALAASTGNPLHGALVMALFSVATAPGLAAGLVLSLPALRRRWSPAWQGALWCALGLFLGLRPLIEYSGIHRCH